MRAHTTFATFGRVGARTVTNSSELLNPTRALIEQIKAGPVWHDPALRLVAMLVARGTPPCVIESMAPELTWPGYTVQQTRVELATMAIVDAPPALSASIEATVETADLVLIPVTPSPIDLEAVGSTVNIVANTRRQSAFIVNKAKRNSLLTADTAEALQRHGDVAPVLVDDRLDYRTGMIQGNTAQEYAPKGKAAVEMRDLWAYVARRLS
jgi:hypothetical protein